ncbi:hypothetical protein Tco_1400329 [Tanacetum coccineum]
MMFDSIDNGPLVYPIVEENGQTRLKKYSELTEEQRLQDDCDFQATNIILHCHPPDVYALVNHQEAAKAIWDNVKLLMKGTELSYQERECRLMIMQQVQVNTKFLNALPSEWSKFVTDGENLIDCINKALVIMSVVASRFPPSNNLLKKSSNLRNQAIIQDGRVMVQQIQGRQTQSFASTGNRGNATNLKGTNAVGQPRTIPQNAAFQTKDLDAYDSDCNDLSLAKVVLMANCSSCDSYVLSKVLYSDSYPNDMLNQDVQGMTYYEQTHIVDSPDNEIHSDSNIIPYSQYLQETQDADIQDTNSFAPNDLLILSLVEQMTGQVANLDKENQTNKMVNESLSAELKRYKELVAVFELRQNVDLNKHEKYIDSQMDDLIRDKNAKLEAFKQEIDTLKETLSNNKTQWIKPTLYDGSVIAKEHVVISVIDDEETLILEEESRSKMLEKQNDLISKEKKVNIAPIDYSKLNNLKEDFVKSHRPIRVEAPSELPKVSLVNESTKKLKYQLANFDKVVKERITSNAITVGSWEIVHLAMNSVEILDVDEYMKKEGVENVKKDIDEIETINIELEHTLKNELRKLKGKYVVDSVVSKTLATTIAPGMFKINLEPLAPMLLKNKDAYIDYINHSKENADILRELIETARALCPLDSNLDSSYKYVQRIQVVLVYVKKTCPCLSKPSEKLVVVTPMNKDKRVRFAEPITSSCVTQKPQDSNKRLLHSTGVNWSTSVSGSKPSGNTENNMISQSSSSNKTNKVEDQSRNVKSQNNKMNHVDKTKCNAHVIWKPTSKNFTIDGNKCPLTRIASTKLVHPKESSTASVITPTQGILVYSRRPKASRSVGSSSKVKNVKSNTPNSTEPNQSWGSTISDVPSSSLIDCRFTSTKVVPTKETTNKSVLTPTQGIIVYSRKLKAPKLVGSSCPNFSVDLEVDFRKHTCFIRDLEGVDLLKGSKGLNLYTLSLENLLLSSPICLLSKASKTKSWLWHR